MTDEQKVEIDQVLVVLERDALVDAMHTWQVAVVNTYRIVLVDVFGQIVVESRVGETDHDARYNDGLRVDLAGRVLQERVGHAVSWRYWRRFHALEDSVFHSIVIDGSHMVVNDLQVDAIEVYEV